MDVSLVVPLQGAPAQALRCLEAVAALPGDPAHEVVVVDDAATGLDALLTRLEGDVEVIRLERRSGLLASLRRGVGAARAPVVAVLVGAAEPEPGFLAPLVSALEDPGVAAAVARTVGEVRTHPVAARAIALRPEALPAEDAVAGVPETLAMGALVAALAARGRVVEVGESRVTAPSARRGGARGAPGLPPEVSVVVPTLDVAGDRVRATLAAVQRTLDVPSEIVVVDNGGAPQGFTAPVNAALRAAQGRYVVVMNDDVEPLEGWWAPLREALDAGEAVVFPMTVDGAMRTDFAAWCFALTRDGVERHGHEPGSFFDPALRVWFQDTDLLVRLRAAGCPPRLVPASTIRHGLSETVATEDPVLRAWIDREIRGDLARFEAKHPGVVRIVDGRVALAA